MKVNAITIGFRRRRRSRAKSIYPPVLYDGNTVAWFDYLENITKDGSDLVSVWGDKSGLAHHLLQATGTNQPEWSINGVLFKGVDEFMKCAAFTWNQPEFLYLVIKQVTWGVNLFMFDGNTTNKGVLQQTPATPSIKATAGTLSPQNDNLAVNTWGIVRCLFNGVASKLIVNETAPGTGDFGAANMGGFTLGSPGATTSNYSNIEVKEIIGRSSVVGEATIYAYLAAKYGI